LELVSQWYKTFPPDHFGRAIRILWILVCDSMPRILEIEIPCIGPCSRSAKWAWDRSEGGCHRTILQSRCRTLYSHTGLLLTITGSLLEPPVLALKEGSQCVSAALFDLISPFEASLFLLPVRSHGRVESIT